MILFYRSGGQAQIAFPRPRQASARRRAIHMISRRIAIFTALGKDRRRRKRRCTSFASASRSNVPSPYVHLCHIKTRTLAGRERSPDQQAQNGKLEFGPHVAVGWHVAVDFETDADFN
jgi:hypothetical protein